MSRRFALRMLRFVRPLMRAKSISMICSRGYVALAMASVVITICGCASSSDSVPPRAMNDFSNKYAGKIDAALKARLLSPSGDLQVVNAADRDLVINQLLLLIDYSYYQIEANVQRNNPGMEIRLPMPVSRASGRLK